MPTLTPVEYNPFEAKLTPVDHDPFKKKPVTDYVTEALTMETGRPDVDTATPISKPIPTLSALTPEKEARSRRITSADEPKSSKTPLNITDKAKDIISRPVQLAPFASSAADIYRLGKIGMAANRLKNDQSDEDDERLITDFIEESNRDTTFGYKVLDLVSQIPAFAGEMATTWGVYTVGAKAGKKAVQEGLEWALKEGGKKLLEKKLPKLGLKVAGGVAGGALQAVPAGALRTVTETQTRMLPQMDTREGKPVITGAGEPLRKALPKAALSQGIEVVSEHSGGLLTEAVKMMPPQVVNNAIVKILAKYNPLAKSETIKKLAAKTAWHGPVGEMFEERVADMARYATGLDEKLHVPSPEQLAVELTAFSVPSVAGRVVGGFSRKKPVEPTVEPTVTPVSPTEPPTIDVTDLSGAQDILPQELPSELPITQPSPGLIKKPDTSVTDYLQDRGEVTPFQLATHGLLTMTPTEAKVDLKNRLTKVGVGPSGIGIIDDMDITRPSDINAARKAIDKALSGASPEVIAELNKTKLVIQFWQNEQTFKLVAKNKNILTQMRNEIVSGDAGSRIRDYDVQGKGGTPDVIGVPSTYPDYFQNKGIAAKDAISWIDKLIKGERLAEGQQAKMEDLIRDKRAYNLEQVQIHRNRVQREEIRRKIVEAQKPPVSVPAGNLNTGDEFTIKGEKFKVTGEDAEGNVIIKDGKTMVVDAFDQVPIDRGMAGVKKGEVAPVVSPTQLYEHKEIRPEDKINAITREQAGEMIAAGDPAVIKHIQEGVEINGQAAMQDAIRNQEMIEIAKAKKGAEREEVEARIQGIESEINAVLSGKDQLPLEGNVFTVYKGNNVKVMVFRNPDGKDMDYMINRFREEYPNAPKGSVRIRHTIDTEGNRYSWMAGDADHEQIETALARHGVKANQNNPVRSKVEPEIDKALSGKKVKEPWAMPKDIFESGGWVHGSRTKGLSKLTKGHFDYITATTGDVYGKEGSKYITHDNYLPEGYRRQDLALEPMERGDPAGFPYKIFGVGTVPLQKGQHYIEVPGNVLNKDVHKYLVQQALSEGKPVPPEVLKDYPELQKPIPPTEQQEPSVSEKPATYNAPTFFSQMQRTLESKLPNKGPALAFRSMIKSWAEKGEFKQEEYKWSGIDEWLSEQKNVSKGEVLEWLKGNEVRVEEVEKGEVGNRLYALGNFYDSTKISNTDDRQWFRNISGVADDGGLSKEEKVRWDNLAGVAYTSKAGGKTKFSQYTTPGGQNYGELLLKLPEKEKSPIRVGWTAKYKGDIGDSKQFDVFDEKGKWVGSLPAESKSDAIEKVSMSKPEKEARGILFKSPHWDESNILAHIRFDERTDADGNKVLFIEEIQSDWMVEGRRKGFALERELQEKKLLAETEIKTINDPYGNRRFYLTDKKGIRLSGNKDTADQAQREYVYQELGLPTQGVPNAPLLKNWQELVLKRTLRYAAENGFDKISWTTGAMQQERYDLSKQVDKLEYIKKHDGRYILTAWKGGRHIEELNNKMADVAEEQLADYIGKDIAQRIIENKGKQLSGNDAEFAGELSGLDLKVGGKWAENLYDRMIPQFLNKYGKKWGARVEEATFKGERSESGNPLLPMTVQSFPITPSMKQSVLYEGQQLFEKRTGYGKIGAYEEAKRQLDLFSNGQSLSRTGRGLDNRRQGDSGTKTIGVGIRRDLARNGYVDLRGQVADTANKLAEIAQVFRSPQFETFRIFYIKDGKIVGQEGVSSRMPGNSSVFLRGNVVKHVFNILNRAQKLNADSFYFLHNHPSGDPKPSPEDLVATAQVINKLQKMSTMSGVKVPQFKGHVIINSGKYAVMEAHILKSRPDITLDEYDVTSNIYNLTDFRSDELLTAETASKYLLAPINGHNDIVNIGRALKQPDNFVTIIYRGSKGTARAIEAMPIKQFTATRVYGKGKIHDVSGILRNRARAYGARDVLTYYDGPVTSGYGSKAIELMETGVLLDAIKGDSSVLPFRRTPDAKKWMGLSSADTAVRVAEEGAGYKEEFKKKIDMRRQKVKAILDALAIPDESIKQITRKNFLLMTDFEFKKFIDELKEKSLELEEKAIAKATLDEVIIRKRLRKYNNYRRAIELPPIHQMTTEQLFEFADILDQFQKDDVFLTQRELETVDKTDLKSIRTWREAREHMAKEAGVPIEELSNINVTWWDKFRWDTPLSEVNPFYGLMVRETTKKLLQATTKSYQTEKEIKKLWNNANKSRKRTILEKLIPQDKQIANYMEAIPAMKQSLALDMTPAQLELAEYMMNDLENRLTHLMAINAITKGRENYYPHVPRSFIEAAAYDNLSTAFKEMFQSYERERMVINILDEDTGNILPLEKHFTHTMYRSGILVPSQNVVKAYMTYVRMFDKKVALDELIPKIDIYAQSLTPTKYTPRGLEIDRSLKKFVNKYLNNKKGRHIDMGFVKQGDKVDLAVRSLRTFTTLLDLGLNIPVGVASLVGEHAANFEMIGIKGLAIAKRRQYTAKGRAILAKYKNFTGRSVWEEFNAPGKEVTERLLEGLFGLFHQATVMANKEFLLSSITESEYNSGTISDERLAAMRLEMGRFRVVPGTKSLVGSTSIGSAAMQYKTWAGAIARTIVKDVKTLAVDLKNKPTGQALTTREAREIYRIIGMVTAILLVFGIGDDKDRGTIGRLKYLVWRESLSVLQAISPDMWLSTPRIIGFMSQLGQNLKSLIMLEEYKTKPGLKGVAGLKRQFTPTVLRQRHVTSKDFNRRYAEAIFNKDKEAQKRIWDEISRHNKTAKPEDKIRLSMSSVRNHLKRMSPDNKRR